MAVSPPDLRRHLAESIGRWQGERIASRFERPQGDQAQRCLRAVSRRAGAPKAAGAEGPQAPSPRADWAGRGLGRGTMDEAGEI
eukprot:4210475-Pyramimonas_sp.AAC.1